MPDCNVFCLSPQPGAAPFTPTGNAEEDWINMLMASPLFQQINDIQDLIDKNIAAATGGKNDLILGKWYFFFHLLDEAS